MAEQNEWLDELQVFCADVGSIPSGNFAWARRHPRADDEELHAPSSIDALARAVEYQLKLERPVALGIESPLFLPVPEDSSLLGKTRPCDKGAPAWASNVGASVMATGIVQCAWLLEHLDRECPESEVHFRWESFDAGQSGLLLWEAFVTGEAKGDSHEADAEIGVRAFCEQLPSPGDPSARSTEHPFSIAAAAALWAGWRISADHLRDPCLVIRA
jgi:hypothetical protein